MLPLHLADQARTALLDYLRATYTMSEQAVQEALDTKLTHPVEGLFKGPYLSIDLPYVKVLDTAWQKQLEIRPPFAPFQHQTTAFERLSTRNGHTPKPTILTTGTGSGKTESFLYPLLDYASQHEKTPGIKAIVLYPMNALATDQAARFAEAIYKDDRTRGKLTVGLLLGASKSNWKKDSSKAKSTMTKDNVIEDRAEIIKSPPDILLTNFKMLDYALMRDKFLPLWNNNLANAGLLKFLVLDELHTYDGAQGTDVANLLRRLQLKLNLDVGQLCPVGTSATVASTPANTQGEDVGDKDAGKKDLSAYASKLFGVSIDSDAIVGETRESLDEFFSVTKPLGKVGLPSREANDYRFQPNTKLADYQKKQAELWGLDLVLRNWQEEPTLRPQLKSFAPFQLLAQAIASAPNQPPSIDYLSAKFVEAWPELAQATFDQPQLPKFVIQSLTVLVNAAQPEVKKEVFVYLRAQFWIRELSGLVRSFQHEPVFKWREDIASPTEGSPQALPAWHCRSCGVSGWVAKKDDNHNRFEAEINKIYTAYFAKKTGSSAKGIHLLLPRKEEEGNPAHQNYAGESSAWDVDPQNFGLRENSRGNLLDQASSTEDDPDTKPVQVWAYRKLASDGKSSILECPCCGEGRSLSLVGGRTATMASVVTSQILSTEFDDADLDQRRALLFANSVQDAAHQAGYVEARNYRFTFRSAIVNALDPIRDSSLKELQGNLKTSYNYRFRQNSQGDEGYVAHFFPAELEGKVDPKAYYHTEQKIYESNFLKELNARIDWEIVSEFGVQSTIGRTLERTGTVGVGFDESRINNLVQKLTAWAHSEKGELYELTAEMLRPMVVGILHHLRQAGGVSHKYFSNMRQGKWTVRELNYPFEYRILNKKFSRNGGYPKLLTDSTGQEAVEGIRTRKHCNWYHQRAYRHLGSASGIPPNHVADLIAEMLTASKDVGLLDAVDGQQGTSYAIEPNALILSRTTMVAKCNTCPHTMLTPASLSGQLTGVACLRKSCQGHYEAVDKDATTNSEGERSVYYEKLYTNENSLRVFAADHTGLLERDAREELEQDFKQQPAPDSVNVLVATSTLEMGIDIGDLNVAMNTSVAPRAANYLQRIGRAGRKSGSALIINFSSGRKAHDQYYFSAPEEMMSGKIDTPGCYLEARDILRRHFMAFILDNWTAFGDDEHLLLDKLKDVLSRDPKVMDDPSWFPNKIAKYIDLSGSVLLEKMRGRYITNLTIEERDDLQEAFSEIAELLNVNASGRTRLASLFIAPFIEAMQEVAALNTRANEIRTLLKDTSKLPSSDPKRLEYEGALENVDTSRKKLRNRQILEHLTNRGVLPNYAFPETGVTLEAQVKMPKPPDTKGYERKKEKPKRKKFELVRPAGQALREMMPGYDFYTQGFKLPVQGFVITDFQDQCRPFHFCSRCDHMQEVASMTALPEVCPKCGDVSFGSEANKREFFRPIGVRSLATSHESRLRDGSEERTSMYANTFVHFDLGPNPKQPRTRGARILRKVPFGIEFLPEVTMRQTNTGFSDDIAGEKLVIQQREISTRGFITCSVCGQSTTELEHYDAKQRAYVPKPTSELHTTYCKAKSIGPEDDDSPFKNLFLYRELKTEAIRILLPISEFDHEERIAQFKAALTLGMRRYFGGNPSHIRMENYTEFDVNTQRASRFVMLYDTIPGGTGYLEKLLRPSVFEKILREAFDAISNCKCQEHGKDGCYSCVLAYEFRNPELLSRRKTEELLTRIIGQIDHWDDLKGGLSSRGRETISIIEESELERMFTYLFKRLGSEEEHWTFQEENEDGQHVYRLSYTTKEGLVHRYRLTPQPSGTGNWRFPGRRDIDPDFLIELDQTGTDTTPRSDARDLLIYLDGYTYHASETHPRFGGDAERRLAIAKSEHYNVWTLTYQEIADALSDKSTVPDQWAIKAKNASSRQRAKSINGLPQIKGFLAGWTTGESAFDRLRTWMEAGMPHEAAKKAVLREVLVAQDLAGAGRLLSAQDTLRGLNEGWTKVVTSTPAADSYAPALEFPTSGSASLSWRAAAQLQVGSPVFRLSAKPASTGGYDRSSWEDWWRAFNYLALWAGPETEFSKKDDEFTISEVGELYEVENTQENEAPEREAAGADVSDTALPSYDDAIEFYDAPYHAIIKQLLEAGIKVDDGFEGSLVYTNDAGKVLAEAILGSHALKFVVDPMDNESEQVLAKAGYRVFTKDSFTLKEIQ